MITTNKRNFLNRHCISKFYSTFCSSRFCGDKSVIEFSPSQLEVAFSFADLLSVSNQVESYHALKTVIVTQTGAYTQNYYCSDDFIRRLVTINLIM